MNFLFPAMLAGLASLALPVILHLIARQKFPVMDFPSIRLLQGENRTNTLAPKLVDIFQLLLRLLVLALLVLAMSRAFAPWLSDEPATHNTVIVIDGSASMMQLVDNPAVSGKKITLFDLAKRRAETIAKGVNAPSRVSVIVAGGATMTLAPLEPGHEHAVASIDGASVTLDGAPSTLGALTPGDSADLELAQDGKVSSIHAESHGGAPHQGTSGSVVSVDTAASTITIQGPSGSPKTYAVVPPAKAFDACGSGLVEAVASACDMLNGRREIASQIIVLTNLRESSFDYRGQRDLQRIAETRKALGKSLQIVFVDLAPTATENLGITNAYIRGRKVMAGADAHVISTIVNTGSKEQTPTVTLSVGNPDTVSKIIKIAPGSRAIVDLTSPVNRAMRTFAKVSINEDSFPADDQFSVPLPVVDSRRVLIVNGQGQAGGSTGGAGVGAMEGLNPGDAKKTSHEPEIDGATILKFVLNPGRELGGTSNSGIDPVMVTPEAVAVQPLSKYEIVVLYDVSSLPEQVMSDLATFVSEGRSLLIICSGKTNAVQFNRSLAEFGKDRPALAPIGLGNDLDSKTPLEISLKDNPHPIVSAFADPRHGDLSVIRFDKIRTLLGDAGKPGAQLPEGIRVTLETTTKQPLAIERALGRGRVMMLLFGFELDRGNIARTRVFPPFMWRMVDYLTGQLRTLPPDQLIARTPGALDVSETNFSLVSDLQLAKIATPASPGTTQPATKPAEGGATDEKPIALTASPDHTVMIGGLAPGRYVLEKYRAPEEKGPVISYGRNVTVQSDPRAGDMARIPFDEVARLFHEPAPGPGDPPHRWIVTEVPANLVQAGGEFWKIFIIALILAYTIEAIVGFLATARRERERGAGQGGEHMSILYWLMGLGAPGEIRRIDSLFWYAANPVPIWVVVLIALVGLVAAGVNLLPQNIMPVRTRIGLLIARLVGFAILLLLFTQIEVRLNVHREVKPRIAVLVDTSGSMGVRDVNGLTRLEAARAFFKSKIEALNSNDSKKADIASIDFSWQLHTPDRIAATSQPAINPSIAAATQPTDAYDGQTPAGMTRLMGSIQEAVQRERDLQGVIVLTDGNDTVGDQGTLLATMLAGRKLPVFPVVFGDAAEPKMASVKISSTTPYVRLGDEFRLNVVLSASNLAEQIVRLRVDEVGAALPPNHRDIARFEQDPPPIARRENVRIGKDPVNIAFSIKPLSVGLKTYRVKMFDAKNSVTAQAFVAEQTVEVIKSQVKVLYLDIPRDESKIVGKFLANDPIVDLARLTLLPKGGWYAQGMMLHANAGDGLPNKEEDLYKYDIVIMGDIPRAYFRAGGDIAESKMQRLVEFVARRGGGLITLGGRDVYAAGQYDDSALARILPFDISATKETQVAKPFNAIPTSAGYAHPLMMLESDAATNREAWLDLPKLDGNNFVGNVKPGASLLAVRDLGGGAMMPIIALQPVGKGQVLSLSADTTWRWEMMRPDEGEDYFRRFWGNAIRTLAPDPRLAPNRPQITRYETNTPVGTTITLSTRLVDAVYQPLRNADLDVLVTSPSGKITHIYPHDGRESPGLYEYQVTLDEAGAWEVTARYKEQVSQEHIVAGESNQELDDVRAKPQAMETFAKATGGQSFTPDQGDQLLARLDLTPRTSAQTTTVAIWNLPAVMTLFILILCIDCLVRKRRGMV